MMEILASLLFNYNLNIAFSGPGQYCLGIVQWRAVFATSLLSTCLVPEDIGKFKLIDIDPSGVPEICMALFVQEMPLGFNSIVIT
jgi:hypothetical protein